MLGCSRIFIDGTDKSRVFTIYELFSYIVIMKSINDGSISPRYYFDCIEIFGENILKTIVKEKR